MEQRKKAIICLEGLGKQFQTTNGTVTALDDINLEILQGEIFGIIGLSGAGKSTLVRCINYLETPTAGRVIFEGQNLSMMKEAEIRKARQSMGMIFQQFNLLAQRNVLQNVCFPMEIAGVPKAEAKKRAAELLKLVGLEERMKAYPAQLSGGQKQRVAIARAMSTNPKVLLESSCARVASIDHSHIAASGKVSEIFSGPKSEIGRQLILGETAGQKTSFTRARQIRVIFNGQESSEPIISNMVLACKVPVNILLADTHDIGGKAMGQMLLQLPEDEVDAGRICNYLKTVGVTYEEVR